MLERLVLLVNQPDVLPAVLWRAAIAHMLDVQVTDNWPTQTDAALVSVYRCDEYGCRAGSTQDTLGVMYVFDTWQFEDPNPTYPRLLIANAVWRTEPPLEQAVAQRLTILAATLAAHNQAAELPIRSLTIDCAVLGMWRDYPAEIQNTVLARIPILLQALHSA